MLPFNSGGHSAYQDFVVANLRRYYPNPDKIARSNWYIIDHFFILIYPALMNLQGITILFLILNPEYFPVCRDGLRMIHDGCEPLKHRTKSDIHL